MVLSELLGDVKAPTCASLICSSCHDVTYFICRASRFGAGGGSGVGMFDLLRNVTVHGPDWTEGQKPEGAIMPLPSFTLAVRKPGTVESVPRGLNPNFLSHPSLGPTSNHPKQ